VSCRVSRSSCSGATSTGCVSAVLDIRGLLKKAGGGGVHYAECSRSRCTTEDRSAKPSEPVQNALACILYLSLFKPATSSGNSPRIPALIAADGSHLSQPFWCNRLRQQTIYRHSTRFDQRKCGQYLSGLGDRCAASDTKAAGERLNEMRQFTGTLHVDFVIAFETNAASGR
jgi:hypothetical protein